MSGDDGHAITHGEHKLFGAERSASNSLGLHDTPKDESPPFSKTQMTVSQAASPVNELPPHDAEDQSNRQLDVTDALGYLDCVKAQFQDQSDVYNRFLDIMKDFKSQIIDTPGVIERVSTLFRGHPMLIQGFNTFLPAGYRIECMDSDNADYITVTTPSGTKRQAIRSSFPPERDVPHPRFADKPPQEEQEIERALSYVQKVKTRYLNDPERYKQFLEVLSCGEAAPENGNSQPLNDNDVLFRVTRLFKDDQELIDGFYHFLGDRNAQQRTVARLDEMKDAPKQPDGRHGSRKKLEASGSSGALAAKAGAPSVPQKRKRKPAAEREREHERERHKEIAPKPGSSKPAKRVKQQHAGSEAPSPSLSQMQAVPPSPRRQPAAHSQAIASSSSTHHPLPIQRPDDTQFFDRVKRALDNRETYNEFLKVVNLFTQDIIDTARLIRESRTYLGEGELMAQFQEILGWNERRERYAVAEDVWTRPTGVLDRPSRNQLNMRHGSYRKLPASEMSVVCSGRDEMCKSVLNDEWVSQPTFATEDAGFLAHKKNAYEEALHRSEEERHEYDFHIEAILRTIQMLEPFNNKIAQLGPDDKANYKYKPNIAAAVKSIHLRVIKKVYGKEAGMEVFQTMQEMPQIAIPLVLARLKQKHEEWKRAQREWNKVWKEVDARNYYKSLDHQGITFKAADKKAITPKTFVSQIEAARDEQVAKRAALIDPLFARTRPRHQLEYVIEDIPVLQDSLKLVCSFLDRTQGQIAFADRKKIETFLRTFVPSFFMLDSVVFNGGFVPRQEMEGENGTMDSSTDDVEGPHVNGSRAGRPSKKTIVASGGDLRKRLLKSEQAKSSRRTRAQDIGSPSSSRPSSPRLASPALPDAMPVDSEGDKSVTVVTNLESTSSPSSPVDQRPGRKGTFFTNTHFYVLFRLLELLYSRLRVLKEAAAQLGNEPAPVQKVNPLAQRLGILTDITKMGDRATDAVHFYDLMLESCERLFDNEIEQAAFEDQMRYMFGIEHSYKIFTIDKLIGAIIKQVQTILSDAKSQDLFELLRKERELAAPSTQDLINSRKNTERVLGPDENLFRMVWIPESKTVTIQLLGKDDTKFDESEAMTSRWQAYVESYVTPGPTDGLVASNIPKPYLQRTLHVLPDEEDVNFHSGGSLSMRVCVRTYKLFYVSNTEDYIWRATSQDESDKAKQTLAAHNKRRKAWLDKFLLRASSPTKADRRSSEPTSSS